MQSLQSSLHIQNAKVSPFCATLTPAHSVQCFAVQSWQIYPLSWSCPLRTHRAFAIWAITTAHQGS